MFLTILHFADTPRAAKTGHITYSQQTLLEMLIEDLPCQSAFQKRSRFRGQPKYTDSCKWKGVTCDEHKNVLTIWWVGFRIGGPLSLRNLPWTLDSFIVENAWLSGQCDLTALPSSLTTFAVRSNALTGSVDLTTLPEELTLLNLSQNQLNGEIDLSRLPASLHTVNLSHNRFRGSLNLETLSRHVHELQLQSNAMDGTLNFRSLPPNLKNISLRQNNFIGEVAFFNLPETLNRIDLGMNQLCGTVQYEIFSGRNANQGVLQTYICMQCNQIDEFVGVEGNPHRQIIVGVP